MILGQTQKRSGGRKRLYLDFDGVGQYNGHWLILRTSF